MQALTRRARAAPTPAATSAQQIAVHLLKGLPAPLTSRIPVVWDWHPACDESPARCGARDEGSLADMSPIVRSVQLVIGPPA